jgi:hypothetical protein
MKKTAPFLIIFICIAMILVCTTAKEKKANFVNACYEENKSLPMSQIDMLYRGYKEHEDFSALNTLKSNCPRAVGEYLR